MAGDVSFMTKTTKVRLFSHGTSARMQYVGGTSAFAPGPLTQYDDFGGGG